MYDLLEVVLINNNSIHQWEKKFNLGRDSELLSRRA